MGAVFHSEKKNLPHLPHPNATHTHTLTDRKKLTPTPPHPMQHTHTLTDRQTQTR